MAQRSPDDVEQRIVSAYREGNSADQIATTEGLYRTTVFRVLKRLGVQPRHSGRFTLKYIVNDGFLDAIGEHQAWFLGLMASDGSVDATGFTLSQSGDDGLRVITEVQKMLGHTGRIYHVRTTAAVAHQFRVTSRQILRRLSDFGIVRRKSLTYRFPEALPPTLHASFFRGYVEGDGSAGIYHTGTCRTFCLSLVGTPEFIARAQVLIPASGRSSRIKHARHLSELRFYGEHAVRFGQWIWANEALPASRKHAVMLKFIGEREYRWQRYSRLRAEASTLLSAGHRPMEAARILNLPFQTVYRWLKRDTTLTQSRSIRS